MADEREKAQMRLQELVAQAAEILKVASDVALQHELPLYFMGQTFDREQAKWFPTVEVGPEWGESSGENDDGDWLYSSC